MPTSVDLRKQISHGMTLSFLRSGSEPVVEAASDAGDVIAQNLATSWCNKLVPDLEIVPDAQRSHWSQMATDNIWLLNNSYQYVPGLNVVDFYTDIL